MATFHSEDAGQLLEQIRYIDARLGLLAAAVNERSTYFDVDLLSEEALELGFGLDANGSYPAL
jgi:hypothetical protein